MIAVYTLTCVIVVFIHSPWTAPTGERQGGVNKAVASSPEGGESAGGHEGTLGAAKTQGTISCGGGLTSIAYAALTAMRKGPPTAVCSNPPRI